MKNAEGGLIPLPASPQQAVPSKLSKSTCGNKRAAVLGTLALELPGTELPCRHLEKREKQLLPSLKEARARVLSSTASGARTEVGLDLGGETREKREKGWEVGRNHDVGQEKCSWYYFHLTSGILQWR